MTFEEAIRQLVREEIRNHEEEKEREKVRKGICPVCGTKLLERVPVVMPDGVSVGYDCPNCFFHTGLIRREAEK